MTTSKVRGALERAAYSGLVAAAQGRRLFPGREPLRPMFLLVGAQRSGTTSLQKYLAQHPDFRAPVRKEVHYFDVNITRGVRWYAAHFPVASGAAFTGDATPYYLFHPAAAARAASELPGAKIVALLRDPVTRARSHHQHETAKGNESLPFADALAKEDERLAGEAERLLEDPAYRSFAHQHHSYASRGYYLEQLLRWERRFGRDRLCVLGSEEFFSNPQGTMDRLTDFLGVSRFTLAGAKVHNSYKKAPVRDEVLERLTERFREPNQQLFGYVGRDLGWRR